MNDLSLLENPLINVFLGLNLRDHSLVAIDAVLLDLVGQGARNHVDLVVFGHLVHDVGHVEVGALVLDRPLSSSEGVLRGQDGVSLLLGSRGLSNDDGVRRV